MIKLFILIAIVLVGTDGKAVAPEGGCLVCGHDGKVVGDPDALFKFPGQPTVTCSVLQSAGLNGYIPLYQCPFIPPLISRLCACGPGELPSPSAPITLAPVVPPVVPPVVAPVVPPVLATAVPLSVPPSTESADDSVLETMSNPVALEAPVSSAPYVAPGPTPVMTLVETTSPIAAADPISLVPVVESDDNENVVASVATPSTAPEATTDTDSGAPVSLSPVHAQAVTSSVEAAAESVVETILEPVLSTSTAPVAAPVPAPVAASVAAPVATPVPAPVATPVPAPVASPVPAPAAAPLAVPVVAPSVAQGSLSAHDLEPEIIPHETPDESVCRICGHEGLVVGNPDAIFKWPGQPDKTCGFLQTAGLTGSISTKECHFLRPLISHLCECTPGDLDKDAEPSSSTPVTAPTMISDSAPVEATTSDVDIEDDQRYVR